MRKPPSTTRRLFLAAILQFLGLTRPATPVEAGDVQEGATGDSLSVAIQLERADDEPSLNYEQPHLVVLTNKSDQPVRIWNPLTRQGYYQLSFHFTNVRGGATQVVQPQPIDDASFWEALADGIDPGLEVIEIGPNEDFESQVDFGAFMWGEHMWMGLPDPNSPDRFAIVAQFDAQPAPDDPADLWHGKVVSEAVTATVISPRLKTPHEYLRRRYSDRAIEIMTADRGLISARDDMQRTPLHEAARYGSPAAVQWLIDNGADVNAIAYNGFTPLHLTDRAAIVEIILKAKPDLSIRDRAQNQTPLQDAVSTLSRARGDDGERSKLRLIVDLYLNAGAEYDILTAIHLNDLDRVKAILSQSPQFAGSFQGRSPLRIAAALGHLAICRYLIAEHGVDVDDFEQGNGYPIIKVCLAHPEVVRLLIENGADLKKRITWQGIRTGRWIVGDDATALHYAASDGIPATITLLIDNGVAIFATAHDVAEETGTQTALEVAALFGKVENAMSILGHPKFDQSDPALRQRALDRCLVTGAFPSSLAPDAENKQMIALLLAKGAAPNATREDGATAIQIAAGEFQPDDEDGDQAIREIIALLTERGATVDLFSAVALGQEALVEQLLKEDPALANAQGLDGYSALHMAVAMNYEKIVASLLRAGGKVDIRNRSERTGETGETALHAAAFWERYGVARQLLASGADINAQADDKRTPLHDAAAMVNATMVKLLLEIGANADIRDERGHTPLDGCPNRKSPDGKKIEKLLRAAQKVPNAVPPEQPSTD